MKKIIFTITLITTFLFLFRFDVKAQYSNFLVPGINCGIAGDIETNKCCAPVAFNPFGSPDFGAPVKVAQDLIFGAIQVFSKQFINPFEELQAKIVIPCQIGLQSTSNPSDINCRCMLAATPTPGPIKALNKFCENQTSPGDQTGCASCIGGGGVWTGIGCVQGSIDRFIGQTVFGWGIGLAGGFSLLCIIYAAFMIQSSQGNPEKLKKAQEMITSCVMGLMLIIFSVFILRLIGVNILRIPGFG